MAGRLKSYDRPVYMYMSNSQKVAIFFIPVLIDYLQIYVIDVHS